MIKDDEYREELLAQFPKITYKEQEEIQNEYMPQYVVYTQVKKGVFKCYCTHCRRFYTDSKHNRTYSAGISHNGYGTCLECGHPVKYLALGFENFEDYTEKAVGIKRTQAYKYIRVLDVLGEEFVHSNEQLGITKLGLIASVDIKEDREEMLAENDLAKMSVKEIQELVDKVKSQGEQLALFSEELDTAKESSLENEQLKAKIKELEKVKKDADNLSTKVKKLENSKSDLEKKLEQAENKIVDIAVQEPDPAEIEKAAAKARAAAEKELSEKQKKHEDEINALKSEYEKKISEAKGKVIVEEKADPKEAFKAYFTQTYDAFNRLTKYVNELDENLPDKQIFNKKINDFLDALKESLKEASND